MMRYFLCVGAFSVIGCFGAIATPVSEVAELNGVQCSPLTEAGEWKKEIKELLSAQVVAGKPYLTRVSQALEAVNQDQVDPETLYNVSSVIRMSICDFPTQYQPVLRQVVINLMLRAAIGGEKDAIYDIMDTYPLPQDLARVSVSEEKGKLSVDDFNAIREDLEESDVDEVSDAEQLKEIVKNALSKAKSAPSSPVKSSLEASVSKVHSDSEI